MKIETEVGRYELKYLLPVDRRQEVLELIAPHVRPDPHAAPLGNGRTGYLVHSLYLDTPELSAYHERLQERRIRNRLRVRTYGRRGRHQPVFLENKRKSGRWVVKQRVAVGDADSWCRSTELQPWTALAAGVCGRGSYLARHFCRLVDGGGRRPVTVVHYEREVLVPSNEPGPTRLTLDHDITVSLRPRAGSLFARPDLALLPPGWMVMELKFEQLAPQWMRRLCRQLGLVATPLSKYGIGVAKGLRSHRPQELRYLTPHPLLGSEVSQPRRVEPAPAA